MEQQILDVCLGGIVPNFLVVIGRLEVVSGKVARDSFVEKICEE